MKFKIIFAPFWFKIAHSSVACTRFLICNFFSSKFMRTSTAFFGSDAGGGSNSNMNDRCRICDFAHSSSSTKKF